MRCPSDGRTPLFASLLVATLASAAPLPVVAVVLPDPGDGPAAARHAQGIASLLGGAGTYRVLDGAVLRDRLGGDADSWYRRCGNNSACWRGSAAEIGIETVVLVEMVDVGVLGLRVLDVGGVGPFRMGTASVGSEAQWSLVDDLFFRPGAIALSDAPPSARAAVDGGAPVAFDRKLLISPIAAGKHTLEIEADGYAASFLTVLVHPEETLDLAVSLAPVERRSAARRWTTWFGVGVVACGLVAVAASAATPAHAVTP